MKKIYLYSPSYLLPENKANVTNAIGSLDEALSKQTDIAFVYLSSRHQSEACLKYHNLEDVRITAHQMQQLPLKPPQRSKNRD